MATSDPLASIRWWWRDWRSSTARATLSPMGRLAYLELLFASHGEPECTLPASDRALSGLAGLPMSTWVKVRAEVLANFTTLEDGRYVNAKMQEEWRKAVAFREDQRRRGRLGAASTWKDDGARHGARHSHSADGARHGLPSPSPSPSPSPTEKKGGSSLDRPSPPPPVKPPAARRPQPQTPPSLSQEGRTTEHGPEPVEVDLGRKLADRLQEPTDICTKVIRELVAQNVPEDFTARTIAATADSIGAYAWKRQTLMAWREANGSSHGDRDHGPRPPDTNGVGAAKREADRLAHERENAEFLASGYESRGAWKADSAARALRSGAAAARRKWTLERGAYDEDDGKSPGLTDDAVA